MMSLSARFSPVLAAVIILLTPASTHAEVYFELHAHPMAPVLPDGMCQLTLELGLGANETGESLLLVDLMWEAGSGWTYQGYNASLTGEPMSFNVSEGEVYDKHRVALASAIPEPPPLTGVEKLGISIALRAPNVSLANYTLGAAALWHFNETDRTEMREANLSVLVSKPDLRVDIALSNPMPVEGDPLAVYASVYNPGGWAGGFKVEFLVDGEPRGEAPMSLGPDDLDVAEFTWTPARGDHALMVVVDPENMVDEVDEENNNATMRVRVTAPAYSPGTSGGGAGTVRPRLVLLANSIDYSLSSNLTALLKAHGIGITYINATNFSSYNTSKFVVILGGPDAYEGVGEIVREVLDEGEQGWLREKGNRGMYVKTNVWAMGQTVMVIAGSDREHTMLAVEENRLEVKKKVERGVEVAS
jgi:hypothetical protein